MAVIDILVASVAAALLLLLLVLARLMWTVTAGGPPRPGPGPVDGVLVVLGSGGHTAEMLRLLERLNDGVFSRRTFVVAASDDVSVAKLKALDPGAEIRRVPRLRAPLQPWWSALLGAPRAILASWREVQQARPRLVLANGPGSAAAALFDAWTAADSTPVGADLVQQLFLYKQARFHFLNKNLNLAAEYCQHAKEAATEAVNTGKFSEAGEARGLYAQVGLLEALICMEQGDLVSALKAVDMVLLMGAPEEVAARAADLLAERISTSEPVDEELQEPWQKEPSDLQGWPQYKVVPEAECPSVHAFWRDHMFKEMPVKLTNTIEHFPARKKWTLRYLLKVAGRRTVPVELGKDYTHAHWTQQLMPLGEFVHQYLLNNSPITGYLAQHSLFLQIPRLMDDLLVPDYCSETPDMNVWLGPAGTVSPLHHDPKHNLLAQIQGYKRVLLFPAGHSGLYPFPGECLMSNTSQVDPENVDSARFPLFTAAEGLSCILTPGDVLYIPPKWWHHVRSLTPSLSISYWWQPTD